MKVSDYIIDFLARRGIQDIFLVSGGGIMHLTDSVGRHPDVRYVVNYHEQACAIAAESYARARDHVGACLVTTGPGSTNALSAIAGAWVDSVPVFVVSGQVRRALFADFSKLRQFGPQEINIDDMARPVVKYFKTLTETKELRRELECAWWHATTGRPGPVWINVPLDIQADDFVEEGSPGFTPPEPAGSELAEKVESALQLLRSARRPVVIGGNGVHLGRALPEFRSFAECLGAPVLSTIGGIDLLEETHPLYMGRFGPVGQRRANFTLQNADLILSLGASMSVSSIGFNSAGFGPKAKHRIMVTNDPEDLAKSNYRPDVAVCAEVADFCRAFVQAAGPGGFDFSPQWSSACAEWKSRYPTLTPDYLADNDYVNTYVFADRLSDHLDADDVILTGNSLDIVSVIHSFRAKPGQRVYTNINFGAMGWDLPAAVGAAAGRRQNRVCLFTGDGTMLFNVQELMTLRMQRLPVKLFIINNEGYESIRTTQTNYFEGRFVGADFGSGIGNPDFRALATAFGLGYEHIANNGEIEAKLPGVLASEGPVLCELRVSPAQPRSPKIVSFRRPDGGMESKPLEDQFPFLERDELHAIMHRFDTEDGVPPSA